MREAKLYVIAGPNGAGKTTFAERFLPDYVACIEFINADLIARGVSPFDPAKASIKAGKILLGQIEEFSKRKIDFAFETTLAGKNYVKLFKKLSKQAYQVHLIFLWIPDVKLAVARVRDRVQRGGHSIPVSDIRRRFGRGLQNLFKIYQPLLDSWSIFDSSTADPEKIAMFENKKLAVYNKAKYEAFLRQTRKHA